MANDVERLNEMLQNVARCFDRLLPPFEHLRLAQDLQSLYDTSLELEHVALELQIEASRMRKWCEERTGQEDE